MAKLVDALVLGTSAFGRVGSSPTIPTIILIVSFYFWSLLEFALIYTPFTFSLTHRPRYVTMVVLRIQAA